jgi:hypothetical protein
MRGSVVAKCAKGHRRRDGRRSSRCVRWYFITEGPRTAAGKRRRLWSSRFGTRRAAEVALRAELSRRDEGIMLAPERLTLAEYAERWLAHMASTREPSTVHRYRELLEQHVLPALGGRQLKVLHWKQPKSEAGARTIVLGPSVVAELRRHRAEQAERRLVFGPAYRADLDLVVAKIDGGPIRPDYASQAFRNLVRRAGLPASVHTLRHSAASFLAAAGVPPSDIAAQLGHGDGGALALKVYVHALPEGLARAGAHLDQVLAGQR